MSKVKQVCAHCGSENVGHDAYVRWDIDKQDWVVTAIFDNADCDDCSGETRIDEVEIEE